LAIEGSHLPNENRFDYWPTYCAKILDLSFLLSTCWLIFVLWGKTNDFFKFVYAVHLWLIL
ncbi:hypothetical protein D039_0300B, partial [Vibrio parahaemolyticus EKP-028]